VATDQPAAHVTTPERNYDRFTVETLKTQLRNRKLSAEGNKREERGDLGQDRYTDEQGADDVDEEVSADEK
jgi:hypothetical protein